MIMSETKRIEVQHSVIYDSTCSKELGRILCVNVGPKGLEFYVLNNRNEIMCMNIDSFSLDANVGEFLSE